MNEVYNSALRKRRWMGIVSLLLPVSLLIFGRAYQVVAHCQESVPAGGVLATNRSAGSQPANGKATLEMRSLLHSFPQVSEYDAIPRSFILTSGQASFPVAAGEKAVWYSKEVNQIHCSLLLPHVTWLGTEFGLKRLDNRARTVQHFCTLDGLPYNKITSLGGQNEEQLYCSAEQMTLLTARSNPPPMKPLRSAVALCRYRADSGKWVVVASEVRNYPQGGRARQPKQSKTKHPEFYYALMERQCVTVGGDHACVVLGPGIPGQSIALISPVKGGAAEKILCPTFALEPFRISYAHADEENLWIGSDLGLLRYAFKAHRWELLLSDLVVTGGYPAEQGGLWLLTQRSEPVSQDWKDYKARTDHCRITHFVPGKSPEHFDLPDQENIDIIGTTSSFTNIFAMGNRVWTTPQRHGMVAGSDRDSSPIVYALNISTHKVETEVEWAAIGDEQKYARVPDAVLANALTSQGVLVPMEMPVRFTGWICVPDEHDRFRPTGQEYYGTTGDDDAGGQWDVFMESGGNEPEGSYSHWVLEHHYDRHIKERYTYIGPKLGSIFVEAVDHNAVWAVGEQLDERVLVRFDLKTHTWRNIPAQEGVPISRNAHWSADGASCWLQTPRDTYRLNMKTDRWENVSARLADKQGNLAFQQVVPDGEDVWLVAATVNEHDAPLPHPPAIPLYRYHIKTDTFVSVQPSSGRPFLSHLLTVNRDSVLLATTEGNFRLDRTTNRWQTLPTAALPVGIPPLKTLAIYEDARSYWFVSTDTSLRLIK